MERKLFQLNVVQSCILLFFIFSISFSDRVVCNTESYVFFKSKSLGMFLGKVIRWEKDTSLFTVTSIPVQNGYSHSLLFN